ncbi:MAG: hypothetical protein II501_03600 [Clostridia bacterium]|nr:hypothetical protein [Clostridia bacterium]
MKKYIEPEIEITEYRLDDAIAASLLNGTESGNEFNTGGDNGKEETTLPDMETPSDDDWW